MAAKGSSTGRKTTKSPAVKKTGSKSTKTTTAKTTAKKAENPGEEKSAEEKKESVWLFINHSAGYSKCVSSDFAYLVGDAANEIYYFGGACALVPLVGLRFVASESEEVRNTWKSI